MKVEKLELNHLAPYLPYGLEFYGHRKDWALPENNAMVLCPVDLDGRWQEIKPILRPLSDLPKAIEEIYRFASNVEVKQYEYSLFVDYYLMGEKFNDSIYQRPFNFGGCPQGIYQQLIENHFDVFGLIESGLAVNINTLK